MADDFDAIIGQAKRIVGQSRTLADTVFPDGATLTCGKCGKAWQATKSECSRYFSTGWPEHCGSTMTAESIASKPSHE